MEESTDLFYWLTILARIVADWEPNFRSFEQLSTYTLAALRYA